MRIGVIASIAHRLPPRDYGPWEQVASTLAEGFVARGHEVSLFGTADSDTSARLEAVVPSATRRRRVSTRRCARPCTMPTPSSTLAGFDILAQPLRLHAPELQPSRGHAHGHDHPRVLVREHRPGVPALRRHRPLRRHQRGQPASRPALRRHDPPRHRHLPVQLRGDPRRLPAVPRTNPPRQGDAPCHRGRETGRDAPGHRGNRPGRHLLPPRRAAPCRWRRRHLPRPRGTGGAQHPAGRCEGAAAPDHLRRAVRPVRRRGPGHRHTGDRDTPRVDARAAAPRDNRLPRRRYRGGRGSGGPGRRARPLRLPRGGHHPLQRRADGGRLPRPVRADPPRPCDTGRPGPRPRQSRRGRASSVPSAPHQ